MYYGGSTAERLAQDTTLTLVALSCRRKQRHFQLSKRKKNATSWSNDTYRRRSWRLVCRENSKLAASRFLLPPSPYRRLYNNTIFDFFSCRHRRTAVGLVRHWHHTDATQHITSPGLFLSGHLARWAKLRGATLLLLPLPPGSRTRVAACPEHQDYGPSKATHVLAHLLSMKPCASVEDPSILSRRPVPPHNHATPHKFVFQLLRPARARAHVDRSGLGVYAKLTPTPPPHPVGDGATGIGPPRLAAAQNVMMGQETVRELRQVIAFTLFMMDNPLSSSN